MLVYRIYLEPVKYILENCMTLWEAHFDGSFCSARQAMDADVTRYLEDIEDHLNLFLEEATGLRV